MANSNAGENFVILGVANDRNDALKHKTKYNVESRLHGNFYVTGIGDEAITYHKNIDSYQQRLYQCIEKQPVDDSTKRMIQRNVIFFSYYEKDIVLMKLYRGENPIKYDGRIYVRKIANTDPEPIKDSEEFAFYKEFIEQTKRYPYS